MAIALFAVLLCKRGCSFFIMAAELPVLTGRVQELEHLNLQLRDIHRRVPSHKSSIFELCIISVLSALITGTNTYTG